ncbi:MAG: LysR family transcriptional regulator [Pigmentiphaga sp.]
MLRLDDSITFRRLEALLAFLQTGNLARAAELLDTSPVSMHRALHALEAGLDCKLFRPQGRNLVPTEAAYVLAEAARQALDTMREGVRATREAAGLVEQTVKLGSIYSLTVEVVPRLIVALERDAPGLKAGLAMGSNAELLEGLRKGELDAALISVAETFDDIETSTLLHDELLFATASQSRYAGLDEVDLRQCREERFVMLAEGFYTRTACSQAFAAAGFEPAIALQVTDIFSLANLVRGGVGSTLLPGRMRRVVREGVALRPLAAAYQMRHPLGLAILRSRTNEASLRRLKAVCLALAAEAAW